MPIFTRPRALRRAALLWIVALSIAVAPRARSQTPRSTVDAVADPRAVVAAGEARFTVLTPQLIRLEWAPGARFENRPSLVFLDRHLPVPAFRTSRDGDWLMIATDQLTLRYRVGAGRFDADNLTIRVTLPGRNVVWHPGLKDTANLGGTARTLDGATGPVPLDPGLVSRDGWTLVDDSAQPLFDGSAWPWVLPRPTGDRQDWYFFGYGHDYQRALRDFTRVAGRIPMPPRFAFGYWWSRYWAYTDREFQQLVGEFDDHDVPIDVLVVDMDWHNTFELRWDRPEKDQSGQPLGWTGYTWDRAYFPDPERFLSWAHAEGLRTTLNLHPAGGIEPWEDHYAAMARSMGVDPATKQYIPFDIADKKFAENFFRYMIHPLERQGVDFWWLDWQQWSQTSVANLNPTWWLNYVFYTDKAREGAVRPVIFHRWGGLGNHRYQIGFSGDAHSTWDMLAFEPQFTATAANVGFDFWSHDIGGHLMGEVTPELYARWIQFGVFSPILRTHTTKNPRAERRIWAYPPEDFTVMRDALKLRYALLPYIYTAARQTYDSAVAMLRPLYYEHPEAPEAYRFPNEYWFGPDMLVSPIVTPLSSQSLLASTRLWLPPGEWIEWSTSRHLRGPAIVERQFALDEIPVYVRAGAIVPMAPPMRRTGSRAPDPLILTVFPGPSGTTRVYEDAGDSQGYQSGEGAWTTVRQTTSADGEVRVDVLPVSGRYAGMPSERAYQIRLVGAFPPARVAFGGRTVPFAPNGAAPGWRYDGDSLVTIVSLPRVAVTRPVEVTIMPPYHRDDALLDGVPGRVARLRRAMHLLQNLWVADWPSDSLVSLVQTGHRITLHPDSAAAELDHFQRALSAVVNQIASMKGDSAVIARARAHTERMP